MSYIAVAQENFASLNETKIELNKVSSKKYRYTFSLKSRQYLYRNENIQFKYRHLDISHFSILSLKNNKNIGLSFLYRTIANFEKTTNEFRITQQYNIKSYKFNHRFRLDQRFNKNFTIHRFRYKLSFEITLKNKGVKKTQLNIGNELMHNMIANTSPKLEYRFSTILNHRVSKYINIQFGLEHRLFDINNKTNHRFVLLPSAIFNI
mgnify:CR=1 FL=1|jgi:hypothetical protein